ncbi:MAG: DUF1015 family protein, partial [Dehalococcoidia bacterium]
MAHIRPFRGLRYNPEIVADLSRAICPPYDIIAPQEQRELYDRSPYNIVRVELGLEEEKDTPEDSRYTRAAAFLGRWVKDGILVPEERPAL